MYFPNIRKKYIGEVNTSMNTKTSYVNLRTGRFIVCLHLREVTAQRVLKLQSKFLSTKVQSVVSPPPLALALMLSYSVKNKVINPCRSKFKLRSYILCETLMS